MRAHLQNRFVIESPFVAPAQKAAQGGGTRLSQKAREGARSKCFAQQGPTRQTILGGSAHLRRTLLADHAQGQRNRRQSTDQRESQSGGLALIIVEPTGKQKADPSAQCNPGSGDEYDLGNRKLSFHHFSHRLGFPDRILRREKAQPFWAGLNGV